jgi:hypothetical protein
MFAPNRTPLFLLALVAALSGCTDDNVEVQTGLEAKLRVANAQYEPGGFPVDVGSDAMAPAPVTLPDGGMVGPPTVVTIESQNNSVKRGTIGKTLRVIASPTTRTVAIGLAGDAGYWLIPVALHSVEFDPNLELSARLDFDRTLPLGPTKLWFAAVDAENKIGPARALDLTILDDIPTAPLVVSLTWTSDMDLDLVVVHPDGSVLTNKAVRPAPSSNGIVGQIDLDSNGNCIVDGHRAENASYSAFGAGEYKVYVRQAQACGQPLTGWHVRVLRDGNEITQSSGSFYASEIDLPNGGPTGPGRLALSFDVGG